MKQLTIQNLIDDVHNDIRHLVCKWEAAEAIGNEKKYVEFADAIVEKINEIKSLKRIARFYKKVDFFKKLFKKCLQ